MTAEAQVLPTTRPLCKSHVTLVEFGRAGPPHNDALAVIYLCVHCGTVMNNSDRVHAPSTFFSHNLRIDITLQGYIKKMCNKCWEKNLSHHLLEIRPVSPQGHNHIVFINGNAPLLFCPECLCMTSSYTFDFTLLMCKCCAQAA